MGLASGHHAASVQRSAHLGWVGVFHGVVHMRNLWEGFQQGASMNPGCPILHVDEARQTVDFYSKTCGMTVKFVHEVGDLGELDMGTTSLAFCARSLLRQMGKSPGCPNAEAPHFEVALLTPDLPEAMQPALDAGCRLLEVAETMS